VSRVAVLWNPGNPGSSANLKEIEIAAPPLGLKLQLLEIRKAEGFDNAFLAITKGQSEALLLLGDPVAFSYRRRILELVAKNRLPAMYTASDYVEDGGLMCYGPTFADLFRRAATYVDKILKGRKPADLPVEQPTKFELVINLKTAKQIGLTIPQPVLYRADKVIK